MQQAVEEADAAVVPGSLIAFSLGISRQDRHDILLCHQMVQQQMRAARLSRVTEDWFAYYKRRLQYLGWYELYLPASGTSSSYLPADIIDPLTLRAIDEVGRAGTGLSAPAVRRLDTTPAARRLLEQGCVINHTSLYRFLPCVTTVNGRVEALLYQRHVQERHEVFRKLSFSRITTTQRIDERLAVIAFRPEQFERHRQSVFDTLRRRVDTEIYPL